MLKDMIKQFATKFYKICALKLVSIKMQTKTGECVHVRCGDHDKKTPFLLLCHPHSLSKLDSGYYWTNSKSELFLNRPVVIFCLCSNK